ncbi:MAG: amidohydrolase family protein [Gammaproteobacteria bacterium]
MLYEGFMRQLSPPDDPRWILDAKRYYGPPDQNLKLLTHALFAESRTDACIYHGIPLYGLFKDGGSPLWAGKKLREQFPGRVNLYGPCSPYEAGALDKLDRMVEEDGIIGIKLYPMDLIDGKIHAYRLDNPEIAYPLIERARSHGIRHVALHKALPLGPVPMDPFRPSDVDNAAIAFPDMTFEVVHGGFAFLEETAWLLARFPNVVINLEGSSGYLCTRPRRFAELLGTFLSVGGADRIYWSVGCMALHPRPFIEAFWNMTMPADLVEDYGLPPVTREIKEKILGLNHARALGLDVEAMRKVSTNDPLSKRKELAPPWSAPL